MKRYFVVAAAAFALLVPTLTFAQVKTVYIPGAHPRVEVQRETPAVDTEKAPLTPAEVMARHEHMAAAQRVKPRVNDSAVAHCAREIAKAREALRKSS